MSGTLLWILFGVGTAFLLALDLGVFHRASQRTEVRTAAGWSAAWVSLALIFCGGVWALKGADSGMEFLTGYLIEFSLSVDNVFLFAVIFSAYHVPLHFQHRVLFWGILTAVVLRGIMIAAGIALLHRFHWLIYPFGILLILTGLKMLVHRPSESEMRQNPVTDWLKRRVPYVDAFHEDRFFERVGGRIHATRLFLVLALVELTDLMFALDSIPAVLAVTQDPFIVFTSNVLAILGLRSLYFLLAGVMERFEYLTYGLAAILVLVGFKMMGIIRLPTVYALLSIAAIVAISVGASLWRTRRTSRQARGEGTKPGRPGHTGLFSEPRD